MEIGDSSSQHTPLVSIITLNYNSAALTLQLLESVRLYCSVPYEIIVVDNASRPHEIPSECEQFPHTTLILNDENKGFSGGNNVGIKAAKGEFIFLVNNDTEFTPHLVERLLETLQQNPKIGVVCPLIRYFEPRDTIQFVGFTKVHTFTARNETLGNMEKDEGQYQQLRLSPYAHGAAMLLPRHVVDEVGLMPEDYFLYYEELDWSEQIRRKGYEIAVNPQAVIFHKESASTGKESPLKTYYLTRNRILFMRRNAPLRYFVLFALFFAFFTVPKSLLRYAGKRQHLQAFTDAIKWHFSKENSFDYRPVS